MFLTAIQSSKYIIYLGLLFLFSKLGSAQLLEIDYSVENREENSFDIQLIRTGILGASSLKNLDFTIEALKLRFDSKKGNHNFFIWKINFIFYMLRSSLFKISQSFIN